MTLREKIQNSIINAGNNFYYDSEYSLNRILDNATFPTAFMYLLQDSGVDRVGTQKLDRCNAQIVFSDLQDFDNTAITTDDIIEDCILKAKHWLSTLQQDSNLELIQITSTKRIYSTFDVQLCGYMVNVQIRERYENKDCINQPLTILETLSQHAQQVATGTQLGHIRSGGDISVDEYGMVTVLNGIQSIQDATDVDTTAIADDKILVAKAITGGFKHVYEDKPTGGVSIIRRSDYISADRKSYLAFAPTGSLETDAVWTITKRVGSADGTIVSNVQYVNKKWTERELL